MIVDIAGTVHCDRDDCAATCRATIRVVQSRHYAIGVYVIEFDRTDKWYGWTAGVDGDRVCHAWCPDHTPEARDFFHLTRMIR